MRIRDDDAKALAAALATTTPPNRFRYIRLQCNQIGANGAKALADAFGKQQMPIVNLNLSTNHIGDEGATALAAWLAPSKTLTHLYVYNNGIGDAGVKALAEAVERNASLEFLDMGENHIGMDGLRALARAVAGHATLTGLVLDHNAGGFSDAQVAVLADALAHNTSLMQMALHGSTISQKGEEMLAAAVMKRRSLQPVFVTGCGSTLDAACLRVCTLSEARIAVLAAMHASPRTACRLGRFLASDGDHAAMAKVLKFMA